MDLRTVPHGATVIHGATVAGTTIGITMAGDMVDGVMRDMVADGVMVVAVMPTPDTAGDTIAADDDLWRHRISRSYTIV